MGPFINVLVKLSILSSIRDHGAFEEFLECGHGLQAQHLER